LVTHRGPNAIVDLRVCIAAESCKAITRFRCAKNERLQVIRLFDLVGVRIAPGQSFGPYLKWRHLRINCVTPPFEASFVASPGNLLMHRTHEHELSCRTSIQETSRRQAEEVVRENESA
jgi:hypothetical protein